METFLRFVEEAELRRREGVPDGATGLGGCGATCSQRELWGPPASCTQRPWSLCAERGQCQEEDVFIDWLKFLKGFKDRESHMHAY